MHSRLSRLPEERSTSPDLLNGFRRSITAVTGSLWTTDDIHCALGNEAAALMEMESAAATLERLGAIDA